MTDTNIKDLIAFNKKIYQNWLNSLPYVVFVNGKVEWRRND